MAAATASTTPVIPVRLTTCPATTNNAHAAAAPTGTGTGTSSAHVMLHATRTGCTPGSESSGTSPRCASYCAARVPIVPSVLGCHSHAHGHPTRHL